MFTSNPYSLWLNLLDTDDFFVLYLLRVYSVLNAQLSPLLEVGGAGVLPWPNVNALVVTATGSGISVASGAAVCASHDYGYVIVGTSNARIRSWAELGISLEDVGTDTFYIYARALFDSEVDSDALPTSLDSRFDNSFALVAETDDVLDGAVLLAEVAPDGTITDQRAFVKIEELRRSIESIAADLGYDATQRTKGTVGARLTALENPPIGGEEGGGGVSALVYLAQLLYSASDARSAIEVIEGRFEDIEAQLAAQSANADIFPFPSEVMADEIAINRVGLSEVNPHAIERGQISVVTRMAGHGQDDTPDFTPDTGDPRELPWDGVLGVFGGTPVESDISLRVLAVDTSGLADGDRLVYDAVNDCLVKEV